MAYGPKLPAAQLMATAYGPRLVNLIRDGGLWPQMVVRQLQKTTPLSIDETAKWQEAIQFNFAFNCQVTYIKLQVRVHNSDNNKLVVVTDQHETLLWYKMA